MNKALGIDIGGTKISYALVDFEGNILGEVEKISTPKVVDEIIAVLKNIISTYTKGRLQWQKADLSAIIPLSVFAPSSTAEEAPSR